MNERHRPRKWEIRVEEWEQVEALLLVMLRRVARRRDTISYSEQVNAVGYFEGPDSHALASMLGEVNAEEPSFKGEPLLISAVVTHKDDEYPGVGFCCRSPPRAQRADR